VAVTSYIAVPVSVEALCSGHSADAEARAMALVERSLGGPPAQSRWEGMRADSGGYGWSVLSDAEMAKLRGGHSAGVVLVRLVGVTE
jgi:hypothetical protein